MKVISLAPNITQILKHINATDKLVGHTIFTSVENSEVVGGWLNPNYELIDQINPDIIFTSDLLQRKIKRELEDDYNVHHSEPSIVNDLIPLMRTVGDLLDENVDQECNEIQNRLNSVREYVEKQESDRPIVYCEEWNDPPMAAGNWVPDAIELAGGSYPFLDAGERSQKIEEGEFGSERPEYFISHVCGSGLKTDCSSIIERGWNLPENVYMFHDDLLNQLSPVLVDGIEYICNILHGYPIEPTDSFSKC